MIVRKFFLLSLAVFVFTVAQAVAAPYCVQIKGARQCSFTEAESCAKRAGELNGACVANPAELRATTGSARYCLVNADHYSSCVYTARGSCETDLVRIGEGACLENPSTP